MTTKRWKRFAAVVDTLTEGLSSGDIVVDAVVMQDATRVNTRVSSTMFEDPQIQHRPTVERPARVSRELIPVLATRVFEHYMTLMNVPNISLSSVTAGLNRMNVRGDLAPAAMRFAAGATEADAITPEIVQAAVDCVKEFQSRHGLKVDGILEPQTLSVVESIRRYLEPTPPPVTGPLIPWAMADQVNPFEFRIFIESLPQLIAGIARDALMEAWYKWQSVCNLCVSVVDNAMHANVVVRTCRLDHENGFVLATADVGPPYDHQLTLTFDPDERFFYQDERFTVGPPLYGDTNFMAVALHEIGHLLGLRHSNELGEVMNNEYQANATMLSPGDIERVQLIYGRPSLPSLPSLNHDPFIV